MNSLNDEPPFLGRRAPDYPPLIQVLRVTTATVPGPAGGTSAGVGVGTVPPAVLYLAYTQQLRTDTLAPRDREPCLVVDISGLGLVPAGSTYWYHHGRLAGAYNGLPVYEVAVGTTTVAGSGFPSTVTDLTILNLIATNATITNLTLTGGTTVVGPNEVFDLTLAQMRWGLEYLTMSGDLASFTPQASTVWLVVDVTASGGEASLGAIAGGTTGRPLCIINRSVSGTLVLKDATAGEGAAGDRMKLPNAEDVVLGNGGRGFWLAYDPVTGSGQWWAAADRHIRVRVNSDPTATYERGRLNFIAGAGISIIPGQSANEDDVNVTIEQFEPTGFTGTVSLVSSVVCTGSTLTVLLRDLVYVNGRLTSVGGQHP